MIVLKVAFQGW